jgi:hydroxymethylbilane synthase
LDASDWDGMILASAGLLRMGWHDRMTQVIDPKILLPAVGQGALGIEMRAEDDTTGKLLKPLEDYATRQCTTAERTLLRRLEGGCQVPIGAWARISEGTLYLDAVVGSLNGDTIVRGKRSGKPENAKAIGTGLAEELLEKGAADILATIRRNGK